MTEPLPEGLVAALEAPDAHVEDPSAARGVTHVQTHISHVFLTAARATKLRKSVRPVFLDFSTRAARNADALRELQLNRRLAPDVYLGIAPVRRQAGAWRIGPLGESLASDACEHALVMRRLADGRDALSLLAAGALGPAELEAAAARIAAFHRAHALGAPAPFPAEAWRRRSDAPMQDNLAALREGAREARLEPGAIEALARAWARAFAARAEPLEARRAAGYAVDGHGDLHLAHLWFEHDGAPPLFVDCIEFSDELRRIDAAADVAFLAMDLVYRGAAVLGELWLARYAEASGDFGLYDVVDLHAAYRAAVRAKVAALAAADTEIAAPQREAAAASAGRHLALAQRFLARRSPGALALVAGTVGVGKSSVARALADASGALRLGSDRTRKALAGLGADTRAAAPEERGLYAPEWTERTYAALLARAMPALRAGRLVLLDATWATRVHRDAARSLAAQLGVSAWLVHVDCDEAVVRERVRTREAHGLDASDAGPEQIAPSRMRFEPPREWPREQHVEVRTETGAWRRNVREWSTRIGVRAGPPEGS